LYGAACDIRTYYPIMKKRDCAIVAFVAVALGAGCEEAPGDQAELDWSALPTLAADTVASIGGAYGEGAHALTKVTAVIILNEAPGTIAVADGASAEVRLFDVTGAHVRTVGGRGEGPGEFRWIRRLSQVEHGIAVWDNVLGRLTILRNDGSLDVARITVPLPRGREFNVIGAFKDGSLALLTRRSELAMRGAAPGLYTDTLVYARLDVAVSEIDTLARVVTPPRWFYDAGSSWGLEQEIFGSDIHATVGDHLLFVGSGDADAIMAYSMSATDRPSRVSLPPSNRLITTGLATAERERRLQAVEDRFAVTTVIGRDGSNATNEIVSTVQEAVGSLPVSSASPVFDRLIAEGDSVVWVRERPLDGGPQSLWVRLSIGTGEVATLTLPTVVNIVAAKFPYLLTMHEDELGAPVLLIKRLHNRG
jgi:hypothetical protein